MNMRSCPRCRGAMYLDRNHYGAYEHCLLCGNFVDLDEPRVPEHGTLAETLSAPGIGEGVPIVLPPTV